ncbi:MAG: ATP-binding protein [Lachnospiraceae bacterium]|jgi:anti-sigma regulatory factor (Ser/Thr protein kinase)|nr:ATP-binding protein [Lachnospiraceae bacterium]
MKELVITAETKNLDEVMTFVDTFLEEAECSMKAQMQIDLAVEEIFVNIASYAYAPGTGPATIRVGLTDDGSVFVIELIDQGVPYNPLAKEDPDITLSAEERKIGGLGILLTKKSMDDVQYEYANGSNILTLRKSIR